MVSSPIKIALSAAIALLAFTTAAHAQSASAEAAARSMIESAQLGDIFEPVADDMIAVRHVRSGLVCHFSSTDRRAELVTFEGLPRGDDVGCVSDGDGRWTTLYATRYQPTPSLEEALGGAVAGIRHRFADAQPTPTLLTMETEGLPSPRVAHFIATIEGERWFTSAIVAQSGEWIFKLRYSARLTDEEDLMRHQLEAGALFTQARLHLPRAN